MDPRFPGRGWHRCELACDAGRENWRSRDVARTFRTLQPRIQHRHLCVRVHAESIDSDAPARTHAVINFYHLSDIAKPGETAERHKAYIREQGWDIRGRIYVSFQGVNAQFSGPRDDALAYTAWIASQTEFKGVVWREYPVAKHMFPKLRLKFRPNLISLRGGMQDLPVTGVLACFTASDFRPTHLQPSVALHELPGSQDRTSFAHPDVCYILEPGTLASKILAQYVEHIGAECRCVSSCHPSCTG